MSSGLELLSGQGKLPEKPVYVVYGDDEFTRSHVLAAIRRSVLGEEAEPGCETRFDGSDVELADVLDELAMVAFWGERRLVVVTAADAFISQHRAALERYVQRPARRNVLVLVTNKWRRDTKLAQLVASVGMAIDCTAPARRQLPAWCRQWAKLRYGKQLTAEASSLLVELVAGGLGQFDQELDKLSCYVGERQRITAEDVDKLVARGRLEAIWRVMDAAADGDGRTALRVLRQLLDAGESATALLAALAAQLRRLAKAYRLNRLGLPLRRALAQAGVAQFAVARTELQFKRLGLQRLQRLYRWMVETDLGIKGDSALPPAQLLERLVVRIALKG